MAKCKFIKKNLTQFCSNSTGGLKSAVFIQPLLGGEEFTVLNSLATAVNPLITEVYRYSLRGDGNTLVEVPVSDRNNGTTVITQTFTLVIFGKTPEKTAELNNLVKAKPIIALEDRNGNWQLAGLIDGCDVTGGDINSGGAKGDFNGYNITFEAIESDLAPFLDSATVTALLALVGQETIEG